MKAFGHSVWIIFRNKVANIRDLFYQEINKNKEKELPAVLRASKGKSRWQASLEDLDKAGSLSCGSSVIYKGQEQGRGGERGARRVN